MKLLQKLGSGWLRMGALCSLILLAQTGLGATRTVRVQNLTLMPGQTNRMLVQLEALGDESAVGFSIAYNTNLIRFVDAVLGVDSTNANAAPPIVNLDEVATFGRVGLAVGLDLFGGVTYPEGTNVIFEILFTPVAGITSGTSAITFTNQPIESALSDAGAGDLPTTFVGGNVIIQPPCAYALNTNAAAWTSAGGSGSVNLNTGSGCAWTVVNTNSWITIAATNGSSAATISYTVSANPGLNTLTGTVVIAGQTFTVTQQGIVCSYALSPTGATNSSAASTNSFSVITTNPCPWSVNNTNPWIALLAGTNGTGNGTVTYALTENLSIIPRTGTVSVASEIFTVTQSGVVCTFALSLASRSHLSAATTNTTSLITSNPCPWSVSNTNSWITILSASNGTGSGTLTYALSENLSLSERTGAFFLGGEMFTITQQAVVCSYALTPAGRSHTSVSATGTIAMAASAPCPWSVSNTNSWITIQSGSNGPGNGTVTYVLEANPISLDRIGTLLVGGQSFVITQQAISCTFTISPTKRSHGFGFASNFFTINAGVGCLWTVVNTNPWISLVGSGSGNGTNNNNVGYTVDPNFGAQRIAFITAQGATIIITQAATTCTYVIAPTNLARTATGGTGVVSVTTGGSCPWTVATTNSWITITSGTNGTGNGSFGYSIPANWLATARTGSITVASQTLPVTQAGYAGGFGFRSFNVSLLGEVSLSVTGGPAGKWELQKSFDLTNWSKLADLTNSTGRVDYLSPASSDTNRFFRAVLP